MMLHTIRMQLRFVPNVVISSACVYNLIMLSHLSEYDRNLHNVPLSMQFERNAMVKQCNKLRALQYFPGLLRDFVAMRYCSKYVF